MSPMDHHMYYNMICPNVFDVGSWLVQPIKGIPFLTISKLTKMFFPVLRWILNSDFFFSFYTGLWGDENCTVSLPCICKRKIAWKIEKEIPKDQNQQGICPKGWLHFGFKVKHFFLLFDYSKCIPYLWQKLDFLKIIQYLKTFLVFESRVLRFMNTDTVIWKFMAVK